MLGISGPVMCNIRTTNQVKMLLCLVLLGLSLFGMRGSCQASGTASIDASILASRTIPVAADIGRDISSIPLTAAKILRLPLGAVELLLAPLPGITYLGAARDIGAGIVAPFEFTINVLSLPYQLFTDMRQIPEAMEPGTLNPVLRK